MEKKLKDLNRQLNILKIFNLLLFVIITVLINQVFLSNPKKSDNIFRTKGIIVEDENGKERILIGNPIPKVDRRMRSDTLNGIVFMDEKGIDRIHMGEHGKLYLGKKYVNRGNDGYSLFFNDNLGEERSGYGFSDSDNSVGLGMDYGGEHGGEAIYLYAAPKTAFMTINADLQNDKGIRDRIVLWHETDKDLSLIKLSDKEKDGRLIIKPED